MNLPPNKKEEHRGESNTFLERNLGSWIFEPVGKMKKLSDAELIVKKKLNENEDYRPGKIQRFSTGLVLRCQYELSSGRQEPSPSLA